MDNEIDLTLLSSLDFPIIQEDHLRTLAKLPEEEEIKYALNDFHPLKTPGEDGLHAIFYQKNWDIGTK